MPGLAHYHYWCLGGGERAAKSAFRVTQSLCISAQFYCNCNSSFAPGAGKGRLGNVPGIAFAIDSIVVAQSF